MVTGNLQEMAFIIGAHRYKLVVNNQHQKPQSSIHMDEGWKFQYELYSISDIFITENKGCQMNSNKI